MEFKSVQSVAMQHEHDKGTGGKKEKSSMMQ